MGEHDSKAKGVDFHEVAQGVDEFREVVRALVAGLIADGFTEREARALVAGFWASRIKDDEAGG
jgi:hypothetical protein